MRVSVNKITDEGMVESGPNLTEIFLHILFRDFDKCLYPSTGRRQEVKNGI